MKLTIESKKVPSTGATKNAGHTTPASPGPRQPNDSTPAQRGGSPGPAERRRDGSTPRRNPYARRPSKVSAGTTPADKNATSQHRKRETGKATSPDRMPQLQPGTKVEFNDLGHDQVKSNATKWLVLGAVVWGCGLMLWTCVA